MKTRTAIVFIFLASLLVFALSSQVMAGEEGAQGEAVSLTGQISDKGMLITDDGQQFKLEGNIAEEVKQLSGQRVEVMGTVKESWGRQSIEIEDYMVHGEAPMPESDY